jgi:hypothetical protein
MKSVFLVALFLIALAYFASQSEAKSAREVKQRYKNFKQRFGKKDDSKEIEEARYFMVSINIYIISKFLLK